jgi:hypothetical protein
MRNNLTVTPMLGYYLVRSAGAHGVSSHLVGKDKHCTCGGNAGRRCVHIGAVVAYLRAGGDPAPAADRSECVHDGKGAKDLRQIPGVCPVCGGALKRLGLSVWRCVADPTHYYRWRGEQNGGAVRRFLTEPHPAKRGPFYAMSEQEREAFLARAAWRMQRGGYTPHG